MTSVPIIREAPSCGWHTIAAVPPTQYGLSSSSQNAMKRARHTEAHSQTAKSSGGRPARGTRRTAGNLDRPKDGVRSSRAPGRADDPPHSFSITRLPATPEIYWQMGRAIFHKSASYLTIPLQSLRCGPMSITRRRRSRLAQGSYFMLPNCVISMPKSARSPAFGGAGATWHVLCWLSDRGAFTPSLGTHIVNALAAASISGSVKTQRR
jgi:hypothetical protein